MLTDDDWESLPHNTESCFIALIDLLDQKIHEAEAQDDWNLEREYLSIISAFVTFNKLDVDIISEPESEQNFRGYWRVVSGQLRKQKTLFRLSQLDKKNKGIVTELKLTANFKSKINGLLDKIRSLTEGSGLSENKKDAIFSKLGALAAEVGRDRTRTEALLSLYLDVTSTLGEGAENLKPLVKPVEKLMALFGKAKTEIEQKKLSAPKAPLQIAPPSTEDDGRETEAASDDEENPF